MNYDLAFNKLKEFGQEHVLAYFDQLSETEKAELLQQIDETDFSVVRLVNGGASEDEKGKISPLGAMQISEIEERKQELKTKGLEVIRAGKAAAVLLAGGMGTRLGSDAPKGTYNIGETKPVYIFERLISNLMDVVNEAGNYIHLFVMTSDKNNDATISFFKEHNYFGYDVNFVHFFKQEMAPAADYNGKIYMESKYKMATSPNGNGGWFGSMAKYGMLDIVKENGIEYLNVFAVDNVLQRILSPEFVGAVFEGGYAVGSKVVRKAAPDEKVGVMCLEDGRPSIVEYYELTEEMMTEKDANGDLAYNFGVILNYLFRVKDLIEIMEKSMPLHIVEKKIPYMDVEGNNISPETPNGYKFETLVLDMIKLMDNCIPFEVERNKEFAPVKNKTGVDSVESARALLKENGIEL
ncbi:MAG: UDPGP type 1 family protein [Lachnospiraceae bacterium]|nr:UDPGP type 1 family protein [Lachnospiraceae bacterium]